MFREVEKKQKEDLGKKHADTLSSIHCISKCLYIIKQCNNFELLF